MNNEESSQEDDPEVLSVEGSDKDDPLIEEVEIHYQEDPDLEDIILLDLTEIEKTRLDLSVSDITKEVEEEQRNCFVCNITIHGGVYLCPICGTFYCRKCIKSVIDRGGQCLNCKEVV